MQLLPMAMLPWSMNNWCRKGRAAAQRQITAVPQIIMAAERTAILQVQMETAVQMEQNKKIELYVHIPFCVKKCDYCDFLSAPAGRDTQEQYVQALLHEIQTEGGRRKEPVASVFIGGGTPSILEADLLEKILKALYRCF